jgi:hypothetical protein
MVGLKLLACNKAEDFGALETAISSAADRYEHRQKY